MQSPHHTAIALLDISSRKSHVCSTQKPYLNADTALFVATRDWKPTRSSRDERSNKLVHPCHGVGLNERTGLPICAATWTYLPRIRLREKS